LLKANTAMYFRYFHCVSDLNGTVAMCQSSSVYLTGGQKMYNGKLLQILSVTIFEKTTIQQALWGDDYNSNNTTPYKQLNLFTS